MSSKKLPADQKYKIFAGTNKQVREKVADVKKSTKLGTSTSLLNDTSAGIERVVNCRREKQVDLIEDFERQNFSKNLEDCFNKLSLAEKESVLRIKDPKASGNSMCHLGNKKRSKNWMGMYAI